LANILSEDDQESMEEKFPCLLARNLLLAKLNI